MAGFWKQQPLDNQYKSVIERIRGGGDGFDAEELETATALAHNHLDVKRFRPSVRRAEDAEQRVQSARQRRRSGGIGVTMVANEDDAHGVGELAGVYVRNLHCLRDGVGHVDGFVEVFVELVGVLQCRVKRDLAGAGGGVDEVLDGAERGVFGVEGHERVVFGVFHDLSTFQYCCCYFFSRLSA